MGIGVQPEVRAVFACSCRAIGAAPSPVRYTTLWGQQIEYDREPSGKPQNHRHRGNSFALMANGFERPYTRITQITGIMQIYPVECLFADQGKLIISELFPLRAYLQFATKAT